VRNSIRIQSISLITELFQAKSIDPSEKMITRWIKTTKICLKKQPDILVTKADKGNVTVLLNRADYNFKMEQLLSDNNT